MSTTDPKTAIPVYPGTPRPTTSGTASAALRQRTPCREALVDGSELRP